MQLFTQLIKEADICAPLETIYIILRKHEEHSKRQHHLACCGTG